MNNFLNVLLGTTTFTTFLWVLSVYIFCYSDNLEEYTYKNKKTYKSAVKVENIKIMLLGTHLFAFGPPATIWGFMFLFTDLGKNLYGFSALVVPGIFCTITGAVLLYRSASKLSIEWKNRWAHKPIFRKINSFLK